MRTNWKPRSWKVPKRGLGSSWQWIAGFVLACAFGAAQALELEWDPSVSQEATGYRIYCSRDGQPAEVVSVGSVTTFQLHGLTPGVTYVIYATAYDATGRESPPSNILTYTVPVPPPDPHAVPITSYHRTASGGLQLIWESIPGYTYSVLFKDDLSEPVWRVLQTGLLAGSASLYYVDNSAGPLSTRFYRVSLVD